MPRVCSVVLKTGLTANLSNSSRPTIKEQRMIVQLLTINVSGCCFSISWCLKPRNKPVTNILHAHQQRVGFFGLLATDFPNHTNHYYVRHLHSSISVMMMRTFDKFAFEFELSESLLDLWFSVSRLTHPAGLKCIYCTIYENREGKTQRGNCCGNIGRLFCKLNKCDPVFLLCLDPAGSDLG